MFGETNAVALANMFEKSIIVFQRVPEIEHVLIHTT